MTGTAPLKPTHDVKSFSFNSTLEKIKSPIEFESKPGDENDLYDFYISDNSALVGKSIIEIGLPKESLIALINRNEQYVVPTGGTIVENGDILLVLSNKKTIEEVKSKIDINVIPAKNHRNL